MEENFSANIKDVIGLSRDEALRLSNNCIGTEHFILGIIRLKNSSAINLLNSLGVNIETLRTEIEKFAISKSSNDTIKKATGKEPIVLLDDIFSKLDQKNTTLIIDIFKENAQTIITHTDKLDKKKINQINING